VIASVHIADVGVRSALRLLRRAPRPAATPGLRHADVAFTAPFTASPLPSPDFGRVGLLAFWDDDDALDSFQAGHPLAAALVHGWRVRLEPLRASGSWPGLPEDVPTGRTIEQEGPAAVLTFGRLRLSQAVRFFRTSAKAEASVVGAPGLIWATALARPPFFATCSLWQTPGGLSEYAYGQGGSSHPGAIAAHRVKPFHHRSAFVRFRPYGSEGSLGGRNPLEEAWAPAG
jgi:hypothetical protein